MLTSKRLHLLSYFAGSPLSWTLARFHTRSTCSLIQSTHQPAPCALRHSRQAKAWAMPQLVLACLGLLRLSIPSCIVALCERNKALLSNTSDTRCPRQSLTSSHCFQTFALEPDTCAPVACAVAGGGGVQRSSDHHGMSQQGLHLGRAAAWVSG